MVGSLDKHNQKRPKKVVTLTILYITIAMSSAAIWSALHTSAVFAASAQNSSHISLMVFLGVVTVLTIAAPAGLLERQRSEEGERLPAANDSQFDLENRRQLFDSLDTEIRRSTRTQRPFAFLRIQIDDLSRINREHGPVVADRTLWRLAQVLQANCRELDTVVRYGHDDFAAVLPEAGPETLDVVTRRIRERLNGDGKLPQFSIRIGTAMFGKDGKSIDALLEAAERELFDVEAIANSQTTLCA